MPCSCLWPIEWDRCLQLEFPWSPPSVGRTCRPAFSWWTVQLAQYSHRMSGCSWWSSAWGFDTSSDRDPPAYCWQLNEIASIPPRARFCLLKLKKSSKLLHLESWRRNWALRPSRDPWRAELLKIDAQSDWTSLEAVFPREIPFHANERIGRAQSSGSWSTQDPRDSWLSSFGQFHNFKTGH